MAKRDQPKQGIIYGPVRPSGGRDRGAILGSLLGVAVVVATVGVLGFGIVLFLQGRSEPPPLPTPSQAPVTSEPPASAPPSGAPSAAPSSTPFATIVIPPTLTPSALASVEPTPVVVTPGPTVFVPLVQVGPGYVTFGTDSDTQLHITDPHTTFAPSDRMVWSAYLTQPANSSDLRIQILKLDAAAANGQRLLREDQVRPAVQGAQIFLRRVRVSGITEGPGLYTVRYVRGEEIMAEGSFLVPEG